MQNKIEPLAHKYKRGHSFASSIASIKALSMDIWLDDG
jgi:hypothetical protein